MMETTDRQKLAQESGVDAAVDGLFKGLAAGTAALGLLYAGRLLGAELAFASLVWLDPAGATAFRGAVVHLGLTGLFGMLFNLCHWLLRTHTHAFSLEAAGILYGLVVFLGAHAFLLPPEAPLIWFAAAYAVYGLVLGVSARRETAGRQKPRVLCQEDLLMAFDE